MATVRVLVLVVTITLCHATCPNSEGRRSSFAASRYPNYYLGCDSLAKTLPDVSLTACIRTCLRTMFCFSMNFKQNTDQQQCELLKHTRNTIAQPCLVRKDGWEYIEMMHHDKCGGELLCVDREALPDGWYRINGSTLKPVLERKTWGEARRYCQSVGADLASISSESEDMFIREMLPDVTSASTLGVIARWKLDGTDPDVVLRGSASYETVDGYKSLQLNGAGGTYAEVPAFDLTPEMTFAFWARLHDPPAVHNYILADWSHPWKFNIKLYSKTANQLSIQIRNSGGRDMSSLKWSISLSRNTWIHFAMTLSKKTTSTEGNVYVNGEFKGTRVSSFSGDMSYMTNSHVVYDVGLKRDSSTTFKGHLKDLAVFGKVLTQDMISDVYQGNYHDRGVWIGLNDVSTEGTFTWSDGSAVTFTNWSPGQPRAAHKLEDCVKISSFKWQDVSCGTQLYSVCERS